MSTLYLHITIIQCEKMNFFFFFSRCKKVHPVRRVSSTFTGVKLYKKPEVNSKPSHLRYCISTVGGMQLPVS